MAFNLKKFMGKHPIGAGLGLLGGGGILGALLGGLGGGSGFFGGTEPQQQRTPIYGSEQEDILNQLMRQGSENLDFSKIEDIEQKRFQEETIPSIAERFTSMGEGGQRSSAFQSALGRAGSDLGTRLGGLRAGFGAQQLGMGLQPRYQTSETPGQPGALQGISGSMGKMLPMILKLLMGK